MNRDRRYSEAFRNMLREAGTEPVRLPPRSPILNAHAERLARSVKEECLNKMILFGERSLGRAISEDGAHCHEERNHRGPDHRLIVPEDFAGSSYGRVSRRERLGGMLRHYRRQVA